MWQLQLVRPDDWLGTTILALATLLGYVVLKARSDRRVGRATRDDASV
jgi:hypothetical protein